MSSVHLIEELVSTSHFPLTEGQAAEVLVLLQEQAAREQVHISELVLCTDDVNAAAKCVIYREGGR